MQKIEEMTHMQFIAAARFEAERLRNTVPHADGMYQFVKRWTFEHGEPLDSKRSMKLIQDLEDAVKIPLGQISKDGSGEVIQSF